jgi:hypothetical protein
MTIPANLDAESNRWGSTPVTACWGPQGGPYTPANTGQGLPVQGSEAAGQSGAGVNPVLTGRLDGSGNVQADCGNQNLVLLASAARTATTASAAQTNSNARGFLLFLDVTTASGTGGLQIQPQVQDPISGNWVSYSGSSAAVTATGEYLYVLYPSTFSGLSSSVKTSCSAPLPPTWRVQIIAGDSSSYTYSLAAALIL